MNLKPNCSSLCHFNTLTSNLLYMDAFLMFWVPLTCRFFICSVSIKFGVPNPQDVDRYQLEGRLVAGRRQGKDV